MRVSDPEQLSLGAVGSISDPVVHAGVAILERVLGKLIEVGPDLRWYCCARSRVPARWRYGGAAAFSSGMG
jgi:hypothetical protein